MSIRDESLLIFDGACGTGFQSMGLPAEAFGPGYEGCNEYLNLSAPQAVVALHRSFLEAGAAVIETNTFGANRIVLAEYDLQDRAEEINRLAVAHAKKAISDRQGLYVAGSVGPTTKLPSLGQIGVRELRGAYEEQMRALVAAGVDLLVIETCQDLLQAKIAAVAAFGVLEDLGRDVPVVLSVTIELTGTMLTGTPLSAVVAAVEPLPLFALGLNCATGPQQMKPHVAYLSDHWPGRISVMPNAGLPEVEDGETRYPLTPEAFAEYHRAFVEQDGVSLVGGCCGTEPAHIQALAIALKHAAPRARRPARTPCLSSLFDAVEIAQEIKPLVIGERMNANGSKRFRKLLLADDFDGAARIGLEQEKQGAHLLDLCCAYAGRDEIADLVEMVKRLRTGARAPLMIDSTSPEAIEAALWRYPGRAVINSVNLEDGGNNLAAVCKLARKYGAAVIALAIGPDGMAMTADEKVAVARAIYETATRDHGLRPEDLLFDMLTFTVGSGDPGLKDAAICTLDAIGRIKQDLPGVFTVLGVSNVSFGLPKKARRVLNSVFLAQAIDAGLDAAIVDAGKILPLASIPEDERVLCANLLHNRPDATGADPLEAFLAHFEQKPDRQAPGEEKVEGEPVEKQIEARLQQGESEGMEDLLSIALERYGPVDIIDAILIPGMRRIGELFGRGEMLLPFVLKSAEVMKRTVDLLEPLLDKVETGDKTKILLATVQGDVHDIGKNLVDIILTNNGYEVINIGTNVPAEKIIETAKVQKADAVGLSGLLVKSAIVMQKSMPVYQEAGLDVPILLGGAALTPRFVAEFCVPGYPRPVVYCKDAFEGLKAVQRLEAGTLVSTAFSPRHSADPSKPAPKEAEIALDNPVPPVPFKGPRHVTEIPADKLLPYLNKQALFRGRWGYRRAKRSADEYERLVAQEVEPLFGDLCAQVIDAGLARPKVSYGYFDCWSEGDTLRVTWDHATYAFAFPRRSFPPHLCISDFFKNEAQGGDVVGFFVATLGDRIQEHTARLYQGDRYHDYLVMHGFAVELTDALAEYWHEVMRQEMGIGKVVPRDATGYVTQAYQGSRYGFGYPACPDLDAHKSVFALLGPEAIGVRLTESMQMVPEVSTSAIVAHHPQAKYFAV